MSLRFARMSLSVARTSHPQGSSRLKGGTATKMILESVFAMAASQTFKLKLLGGAPVPPKAAAPDTRLQSHGGILGGLFSGLLGGSSSAPEAEGVTAAMAAFRGLGREILLAYEAAVRAVYTAKIHESMALVAETLRAGRSVWYIGSGLPAMVGMIDASEQVGNNGSSIDPGRRKLPCPLGRV
eukprot:6279708-Pyramimonas_sp.AAC.1